MKKVIIFFSLMLFVSFLYSCSKDDKDEISSSYRNMLIGKWSYSPKSGSFTPMWYYFYDDDTFKYGNGAGGSQSGTWSVSNDLIITLNVMKDGEITKTRTLTITSIDENELYIQGTSGVLRFVKGSN